MYMYVVYKLHHYTDIVSANWEKLLLGEPHVPCIFQSSSDSLEYTYRMIFSSSYEQYRQTLCLEPIIIICRQTDERWRGREERRKKGRRKRWYSSELFVLVAKAHGLLSVWLRNECYCHAVCTQSVMLEG